MSVPVNDKLFFVLEEIFGIKKKNKHVFKCYNHRKRSWQIQTPDQQENFPVR